MPPGLATLPSDAPGKGHIHIFSPRPQGGKGAALTTGLPSRWATLIPRPHIWDWHFHVFRPVADMLGDLGQVTSPLWASVASSLERTIQYAHLLGHSKTVICL